MFSFFDGGIKDTTPSKILDFPGLIRVIKSNPQADKIETIRTLRKKGDAYKALKEALNYITPNCIVKTRNLKAKNFDQNLIGFSGYLYFDFDVPDANDFKTYFIKRYGHQASMVCLSSSGGGVSVLFKIKNTITKDNFHDIWQAVRNTILKDEEVDTRCKDLGRAMYISHDESPYYNYENEVEVEIEPSTIEPVIKQGKQCKTGERNIITLNSPFSTIPINQVLDKLITRTHVETHNPVVDYNPVEYLKIYIPKIINDGSKHRTFTSMIHALVHLNPNIEREYIFSYLYFINERFADPKMERREFIRLFNTVYNGIKNEGGSTVNTKIKSVHINPDCKLSKKEKISVANTINGIKRKNTSIEKIINAKNELRIRGLKITQRRIAEISGLSPKTVRTHLNSSIIDMDEMIQLINDSIPYDTCMTGNTSLSYVA